ncbi:UNVERIFIED_CONTAM: hypothetical protein FKN15_035184 [Acipenser sinensis]
MGLLGVLICHLLKKKGYRCTTDTEADIKEEKNGEEKTEMNDTFSECNADTVGQIVHYIMKNEANSEALKAMVQDSSIDPDSPTTPNSPIIQVTPSTPLPLRRGSTPAKHTCQSNHLHTIGGMAERNVCSRCNHKKWPLIWQGNKAGDLKRIRHGAITVLSVGRFRVTKAENRSNPKARKSLISESQDGMGSNGEVPATPTQEESKSRAASESQPCKISPHPCDVDGQRMNLSQQSPSPPVRALYNRNSVSRTGWFDSSFQGQSEVSHPKRGQSHNTRSRRLTAVDDVSVMDWKIRDCTRYRRGRD